MSVNDRRKQAGAAMVEMAVVLTLFLLLVFGIMEFAMAYFTWHRVAEGARDGLRYVIVSGPVTSDGELGLTCPGPDVVVPDCTDSNCLPLLEKIQRVAPFVQGSQVMVTYACTNAGNPERPETLRIPEITVQVTDLEYTFAVPGIIGLGQAMNLPDVTVSRTGEDLFTSAGS